MRNSPAVSLLMILGYQLARGSSFSREFSVPLAGKGLSSSKERENRNNDVDNTIDVARMVQAIEGVRKGFHPSRSSSS